MHSFFHCTLTFFELHKFVFILCWTVHGLSLKEEVFSNRFVEIIPDEGKFILILVLIIKQSKDNIPCLLFMMNPKKFNLNSIFIIAIILFGNPFLLGKSSKESKDHIKTNIIISNLVPNTTPVWK